MDYAKTFFEVIDNETERSAKEIRQAVFSLYRDMPWTSEQFAALQPVLRQMLEDFTQSVLGIFDNVGCTRVPEGVLGYRIKAVPAITSKENTLEAGEEIDLSAGADYAVAWKEYLAHKKSQRAI